MPTYVYECRSCGETFEREQRITESPLTKCDECGQDRLARVIQPVGIAFKGSGFYVNDSSVPAKGECTGQPESCPRCSSEEASA